MGADRKFFGQLTVTEDFDPLDRPVGQARFAQGLGIHRRSVIELVERLQIHRDITLAMAGVVKSSLRYATDERHLAPFESNTNRTARTGRLPFATAAAGLTVAAGLTLAETFAAMLGSRPRLEVV